jgi:hypothetical protein
VRQAVLPQVRGCCWLRRGALTLIILGLLAETVPSLFAQATPVPNPAASKKGASKKPADTKKTDTTKKAQPAPKAADPAIDPVTGLPKDYKVPPETPDVITNHEPLLTPQEIADLKKIESKYKSLLRGTGGALKEDEKATIRKGIQYRLALLCEKENLQQIHKFREDLTVRDLQNAGKLIPAADVRNFRRYILQEILKQTEALLKKNLYVRIQAVTLLGELDLTEPDAQGKLKLEAFTESLPVLVKVISDPEQPDVVKIAATRSIVRLLRFGVASVPHKYEVANAVTSELKDDKKFFWYQLRLAEALSLLDVTLDLTDRKPFIVNTLRMVMNDPKRDWQVRSMAVRSLGRVPFDPSVPVATVMAEIAQFANDMAKAAQAQPKNAQWTTNFWWLYLAFNALDANDMDAAKKIRGGLRNNPAAASACEPVYQLVHPITNALLNGQPVTVQMVKAIEDWLQKNKPPGNPPGVANNPGGGSAGKTP